MKSEQALSFAEDDSDEAPASRKVDRRSFLSMSVVGMSGAFAVVRAADATSLWTQPFQHHTSNDSRNLALEENFGMSQRDTVYPKDSRSLYDKHHYAASIRSGDLLFISGQVGARADGTPEPDFARQVDLAFSRLEAVLGAAGCSFQDVVDVTIFSTDPKAQWETINPVREKAFGGPPYANLTVVGVTYLSGFDVEVKVIARIPSVTKERVSRHNPSTIWDMASGGFSQISVAEPGRLAVLSGQIAAAPGTKDMPSDVAGQAVLATSSLAAALKELSATPEDIVMLRVYVVQATTEAFGEVLTALRKLLGDAKPSITTIGVQQLYSPEIRVEIEMAVRLA